MKKRNRDQIKKIYGPLYKWHFFNKQKRHECFYCGDVATEAEHCPPLAWVDSQALKWWNQNRIPFVLVSSCSSCNRLLGSKPLFTLKERAQAVEDALLLRYEKVVALWAEDEIAEMSPMFQGMIREKKKGAEELLVRARHAQWRLLQEESFPAWEEPVSASGAVLVTI